MHNLTFLRHGESEGNSAGVLQGQADFPLTSKGVQQAENLAQYWQMQDVKYDLIVSSPLKRAAQTAQIIANTLKSPLELDSYWMERNFGHLQGADFHDIDRSMPAVDFFHPYEPIGGNGESQIDLYLRACQAIQSIIRRPAGSYLIVSHGGILNKALYVIIGITPQSHYNSLIFHFGNTGFTQIRYNSASRQWAVLSLNNQVSSEQTQGKAFWKQD